MLQRRSPGRDPEIMIHGALARFLFQVLQSRDLGNLVPIASAEAYVNQDASQSLVVDLILDLPVGLIKISFTLPTMERVKLIFCSNSRMLNKIVPHPIF